MTALRNLRDAPCFAELAEITRETCSGRRVFYLPNPGNWGDGLIHAGVRQFLAANGIEARVVHRPNLRQFLRALEPMGGVLPGSVLIAPGCGAWGHNYASARDMVAECLPAFDRILVYPTTLELPPIDDPEGKITYFRRDNGLSAASVPDSRYCHDMAFYLDLDIPEPPARLPEGNFFRTDEERAPAAHSGPESLDLSLLGTHTSPALPFCRLLSLYDRIRTDRMHIGIAGAMMGREVELFTSNYGKIPDLHAAVLAEHYPNVTLRAWETEDA